MSNNITALVFGSRYPYDDPRRLYLDERLQTFFNAIRSGSMVNPLPEWMKYFFKVIPVMRWGVIAKYLQQFADFALYVSMIFNIFGIFNALRLFLACL